MSSDAADEEPGRRAVMPGDFAWTISLMDNIARTEKGIADTLRAMAEVGGCQGAARRLKLAEEADKAAQEAAQNDERLRRQADRLARHAHVVALIHLLDHAGRVLADLARTEKDIADALTRLASCSESDRAASLQDRANEALADAQRANDRARSLDDLALVLGPKAPAFRTIGPERSAGCAAYDPANDPEGGHHGQAGPA